MSDFLAGISARAEEMKAEEPAALRRRIAERRDLQAVEYRVDVVREKMIGDAVSEDYVQLVLNDRAADGWVLRSAIDTQVTSQVTRGGSTSGIMLIFERARARAADAVTGDPAPRALAEDEALRGLARLARDLLPDVAADDASRRLGRLTEEQRRG